MESLFPILLIGLAFVLLFVLPARQRKKMADRQTALQRSLTVGAPIMLTCGLHGTVAGLHEDSLDVEIAPGTVVRFARPAVLEVRNSPDTTAGDGRVDLSKNSGDPEAQTG